MLKHAIALCFIVLSPLGLWPESQAWGYVDPGSGFVFLQGTSHIWLFLLAVLLVPLKFVFKFIKKWFWWLILGIVLIAVGGIILMNMIWGNKVGTKVIVLGIDAMDFSITQRLMAEGRLPNLAQLKSRGVFSSLATTNPAESIVAWSTIATGLNPALHDVFDFVARRPKDYLPFLAFSEAPSVAGSATISQRRKGRPFWSFLSEQRIPSYLYFFPNTFPAEKLFGKMISGMGTPDLLGMTGKFSFYTTGPLSQEDAESRGRIISVIRESPISTYLYGPKVQKSDGIVETKVPLKIELHSDDIRLTIQKNSFELRQGEWSAWRRVSFKMGLFKEARGIVRFYLKSLAPHFELYVTPFNIDPGSPEFPISYPQDFASALAKRLGPFHTQGMPHDTWPLSEGRLEEKTFLEQTDTVFEERKGILFEELKGFESGVFFFYFDTLDAVQHMFWRYIDPKHPRYEPDSVYQSTIFEYYRKMDACVGEILNRMDESTFLIILSDHGFSSFRKSAHLNRWLLENGFLSLKAGSSRSDEFFEDVDWTRTRAYALGFGGIYLNLRGREGEGIVPDSEREDTQAEIREKLEQWRDPASGQPVVRKVYLQEQIFPGADRSNAPDLFVGFNEGFRASWQTALGGVPEALLEDNSKKWSGDHLVDPSLVPGVLFLNKRTALEHPRLEDIAPTILGLFDIPRSRPMEGEALLGAGPDCFSGSKP